MNKMFKMELFFNISSTYIFLNGIKNIKIKKKKTLANLMKSQLFSIIFYICMSNSHEHFESYSHFDQNYTKSKKNDRSQKFVQL